MASFVPSWVINKALRFILSRFQVLETDEWDLDNFNYTWGMKNTIELRDVGVRIEVRPNYSSTGRSTSHCHLVDLLRNLPLISNFRQI